MNKEFAFFYLYLVRLGIGHSDITDSTDILKLNPEDWEALKALATEQGLLAVVLDGLDKLPSTSFDMPAALKKQWIDEVLQGYEYRYELYRRAIAEMAGFYNSHGFKMMVLKGYACSLDWPKPEHRPTGDIDIWQFGKQKEADAVLVSNKKIEIDNSHHHHTIFFWRDFMVENHYDFINVYARRSNKGLEEIFKELGRDDSHAVMVYGEKVYLPSANLHALFLIRHMAAHFAAAEISLRQVLDWAFFVEMHANEIDWLWLKSVLEEYHLKEFTECLNAICMGSLGFIFDDNSNFNYGVDDNLKERVLADILQPEYVTAEPKKLIPRLIYKYRRWQGNAWKQRLCYPDSRWSAFWSGLWAKMLKPSSF